MPSSKPTLHRPSRSAPPSGLRLERWQRRAIYLTVASLLVSGLLWVGAHFWLRPVTEFGEAVSPIEPWSMKIHGAAAMAMLFFIGSLLNGHLRRALRARRNRASGWGMIGLLASLTISGYGLYYLASETARPVWSLCHWVIGVLLGFGLVLHIWLGRRTSH